MPSVLKFGQKKYCLLYTSFKMVFKKQCVILVFKSKKINTIVPIKDRSMNIMYQY